MQLKKLLKLNRQNPRLADYANQVRLAHNCILCQALIHALNWDILINTK